LKIFYLIFLLCICVFFKAQEKEYQLIDATTKKKTIVQDSVSAVKFLDSLAQNNYYLTEVLRVKKDGAITEIYFDKGKNFNEAQVKIPQEIAKTSKIETEFFTKNLDSLKKEISEK